MNIEITTGAIDTGAWLGKLDTGGAGAVVTFSGTVRPMEGETRIDSLHYEHYDEMARGRMREIVSQAIESFSLTDAVVVHRVGDVGVGESSVFIAVSAERRRDAFAGCSSIIDRIKQEVPIWKKDVGEKTQWQSERK